MSISLNFSKILTPMQKQGQALRPVFGSRGIDPVVCIIKAV